MLVCIKLDLKGEIGFLQVRKMTILSKLVKYVTKGNACRKHFIFHNAYFEEFPCQSRIKKLHASSFFFSPKF